MGNSQHGPCLIKHMTKTNSPSLLFLSLTMVASVPTSTLLSLARYHLWAYKQVLNGLKSMKDEDYYGHAGLVFRSIHGTLNHLHAADVNWYPLSLHIRHVINPFNRINVYRFV